MANQKIALEFALQAHHMADDNNLARAYLELREMLFKLVNADTDKEFIALSWEIRKRLGDG